MTEQKTDPIFIVRSCVNSFHYLYQDATYLHNLANDPTRAGKFERVQLSRTALILYIISLEALINQVGIAFLPAEAQMFFRQREANISLEDKWFLLPLMISQGTSTFDRSRYPWSHFKELVRIRNDYIHPKHKRGSYMRAKTRQRFERLETKDIPADSDIREADVLYGQTKVYKDPHQILPNDVDPVKRVVDDMIKELDRILGGQITKGNWLHQEVFKLVYPPGATLNDLPPDPNPPKFGT